MAGIRCQDVLHRAILPLILEAAFMAPCMDVFSSSRNRSLVTIGLYLHAAARLTLVSRRSDHTSSVFPCSSAGDWLCGFPVW